jgi:hypothetical protein
MKAFYIYKGYRFFAESIQDAVDQYLELMSAKN